MPKQTALHTSSDPSPGKAAVSAQAFFDEFKALFAWWYVEIPMWYMALAKRIFVLCDDTFSISLLVKTFLVPWHRDTSWLGYGFGISIRIIYLPFALTLMIMVCSVLLAIAVFWGLLPILTVISILRSPFV